MSTKGIFSALSGAIAQSQRLDTIANNVANVNTPGFKRDQQVFNEYLSANEKEPSVMQIPKVPASIESFYDMQGGDTAFVDSAGTYTDFSQGGLKSTGNPLDVAIDGQGFFEIGTTDGIRLTRHGSFNLDGNGQLVTKEGLPVLAASAPGTAPEDRVIRVQGNLPISIGENGDVFEGDNQIARLAMVDVKDKDHLQKVGTSLYDFKKNAQPEVVNVNIPNLRQGFVELSNVNVVREMTDMITATRSFESTQKAISAYDSIADKLVNVVPKVG